MSSENKIDGWWVENNAPINLHTVGRINFSTVDRTSLNKILDRDVLLEIMKNNDRMRDFYHVGPVQRVALEHFVEDLLKYISKS